MFPAASITGTPLPGTSMGDALATMERLSRDLPRNMATEWTEVSYLQKEAGKLEQFRDLQKNPFSAFALGVMLVYFVLAGLYEGWSLPWAVILVVPMPLSAPGGPVSRKWMSTSPCRSAGALRLAAETRS
jgi:multidrug efflux pump